jgi:PAS domain S-box-containing protein/putative nucleotidyltransferase with HDIG domain
MSNNSAATISTKMHRLFESSAVAVGMFNALLEEMEVGAAVISPEGVIYCSNQKLADILGLKTEDMLDHPIHDWIGGQPSAAFVEVLHDVNDKGCQLEIVLLPENEKHLPAVLAIKPIYVKDNSTPFFLITVTPVDRKNGQSSPFAENLAHFAVEQAACGIIVCDAQLAVVWANNYALELCKELAPGMQLEDVFPLELPGGDGFSIQSQTKSGKLQNIVTRKDYGNQVRHFLLYLRRIDDGREDKQFCVISITDITQRVAMEEMLRESEHLYRDLFDHSQEFICLHDLQGKLLLTNNWFTRLLGYKPEELVNMNIRQFLSPEVLPRFEDYLEEICTEGESKGVTIVKTVAGEERYIRFSNTLRLTGEGAPLVRVIAHDITDLWQAESELKQRTADLEERVKELNFLVSLSQLAHLGGLSLARIMQECVDQLPHAFRFSELTCARIVLGDEEFCSNNYAPGVIMLSAEINTRDEKQGEVAVSMLTDAPEGMVSGFLPEEKVLVETTGKILSQILQRKLTEQQLLETIERYKELYDANPHPMFIYDLETLRFLDVNDTACQHLGYSHQELMAMTLKDIHPPEEILRLLDNISRVTEGLDRAGIWQHRRKDGELIMVEITSHTLQWQGRRAELVLAVDMTERITAERKLVESKERYRYLFEANPHPMYIYDLETLRFLTVNQAFARHYGYSRDELLEMTIKDIRPEEQVSKLLQAFHRQPEGLMNWGIWTNRKKSGELMEMEVIAHQLDWDGHPAELVLVLDVTERLNTERQLKNSEERYRRLAENAADLIYRYEFIPSRGFTYVSPAATSITGYTPEDHYQDPELGNKLVHPDDRHLLQDNQALLSQPVTLRWVRKDGEIIWTEQRNVGIYDDSGELIAIEGIARDITARKQAEQQLRLLATAMDAAANAIMITDLEGVIEWVNPAFCYLTGYSFDECIGNNPAELLNSGKQDVEFYQNMWAKIRSGEVWQGQLVNRRKDGRLYSEEMTITPVIDDQGQISHFVAIKQDVTERNQRQRVLEAIATISNVLRTVPERKDMLPALLEQVVDLLDAQLASITLIDPFSGENVVEHALGEWTEAIGMRQKPDQGLSGLVISSKTPVTSQDVRREKQLVGMDLVKEHQSAAGVPLFSQGEVIGSLWVGRKTLDGSPPADFNPQEVRLLSAIADIAANAIQRATLFEQAQKHLHRLAALHTIDLAINSMHDLRMVLEVIVKQAVTQLQVDAVDVLVLNPHSLTLEFAAGHGFYTKGIQQSKVRLGEGLAGVAALEQRKVFTPDLSVSETKIARQMMIAGEGFISHLAVPLTVKGQIKGVFEVFQRSKLDIDTAEGAEVSDWQNFLDTLVTQTAIAIDNAQLYERLQRSHIDLKLAYEATIEGWSRAMDLYDEATEGHTQRATELTIQLARMMGMDEEKIVDLRRGALLHDIGKMAIPDAILLKPAKLNAQEWETMRQHPVTAYQLLSKIDYLKKSLDIPYCHHEKWDGSGYPRGLKGEEIPLAARIFAVADVWDALRSDRPYRPAWSEKKALEYMRENSGSHFDPQVVETFLAYLGEGESDQHANP